MVEARRPAATQTNAALIQHTCPFSPAQRKEGRQTMISRITMMIVLVGALSLCSTGCGRMFSEGMGAATGASGRVAEVGQTADLSSYRGLTVEPISIAPGLRAPTGMLDLIRKDLTAAGQSRGLTSTGTPRLRLAGEVIHYEDSTTVDTLLGPLEQLVLRATLTDTESGRSVASANLVGRAKSSSASGTTHISAAVAKALDQWLEGSGVRASGETSAAR